MKIKYLRAAGLKGSSTFQHELSGVTVLTGVNTAGKTTRLEALQLALAGYVPGISAKPGDIHEKFASELDVNVAIETDQGSVISRNWTMDRKGSVKCYDVFRGLPEGFAVAPVLLDPTVFLGLSAKERTKFLFRTLPPPALDKVGPAVLVANIKNIKLEENTEATEAVISELCKWVADDWTAKEPAVTVQEWLDALAEKVRLRGNAAAATVKRMETTNAGLTQLKVDGASFASAEQAKAAVAQVLDDAKRVLNECRSNYAQAKKELDEARALAGTAVDETEVRRCIGVQEAIITQHKSVAEPGAAPVAKVMPGPRPTDSVERQAQTDALNHANSVDRTARESLAAVELCRQNIKDAKNQTTCPTCGHDVTEKRKPVIITLKKRLQEAELKLKSDADASINFKTAPFVEAAQNALKAIVAWDEAKAVMDGENQSVLNTHNAKVNCWNGAQKAINDAMAAIQRLQAQIAGNQAAAAAQAKLTGLEYKENALLEAGNLAKKAETNAGVDFMTVDAKHRQAIADRATAQSQARALAEAARAKCEVEIVKQFASFLNELMIKVIEMSVQPLLATCNRICDGILRHPLELVDGEIGMRNPAAASGFVSWKTFSGAERALTFAGLSVALSVGQPFKLVMIDEFGKLSAENKTKMFGRLLDLVRDGYIDQAIIVDPDTAFYRNVGEVKDFVCIEIVRY